MRKIWALLVLVTLAGPPLTTASAASAAAPVPRGRLGVGDSIMVSASAELSTYGMSVNAEVGRQFSEGLWVVRTLAMKGTLPRRVIVHLGTNGWIDPSHCTSLVEAAGRSRRVFLVTVRVPRDWMQPNNRTLQACAAAGGRVHLIRWAMVSGSHPEWFSDDGYHLNSVGQDKYAAFIDARVDVILASVMGAA